MVKGYSKPFRKLKVLRSWVQNGKQFSQLGNAEVGHDPQKITNWVWESKFRGPQDSLAVVGEMNIKAQNIGYHYHSYISSISHQQIGQHSLTPHPWKDTERVTCYCMMWEELDTHAHKSAANTSVSHFGFDSIPYNNTIKETFTAHNESIPLSLAQNKQSSKCLASSGYSSIFPHGTVHMRMNNNYQSNMHQGATEFTNKCIASSNIFDLLFVSGDLRFDSCSTL